MIFLFDFLQAIATFILIFFLLIGITNIWIFFLFNTLRAIFQTFHMPSVAALTPIMIPKDKMTQFEGFNQLFNNIILLLAPLLGAVLIEIWSLDQVLWVDIITFGIALALLIPISFPKNQNESPQKELKVSQVMSEFQEGIRVIREVSGLWALIILGFFVNFFLTPLNSLITYFINVTHNGNVVDMAVISIVFQISMILGSVVVIVKKNWSKKVLTMALITLFLFIGLIVMAISPYQNFFLINFGAFVACLGVPIFSAIFLSLIKIIVPIRKIGRVAAFVNMILSLIVPFGYLISGPLAEQIGIQALLIISASLGILVMFAIVSFSKIRNLDIVETPQKQITKNEPKIVAQ